MISTSPKKNPSQVREYHDKINVILEWSKDHPKFNQDFIRNVLEKTSEYQSITEKQMSAIDNIITKFKIDEST
jgi:hypothetical protein